MSSKSRTVHLISQEGESYDVPVNIACQSQLVKAMVEEDGEDDDPQEVPLPNVKSSILAKVVEYCTHYSSDPMTEIEKVKFAL